RLRPGAGRQRRAPRRRRGRRRALLDQRHQLARRALTVRAGARLGAREAALLAAIDAGRARHQSLLLADGCFAAPARAAPSPGCGAPSLDVELPPRPRISPRSRKLREAPSRMLTSRSYTVGSAMSAPTVPSPELIFSVMSLRFAMVACRSRDVW